MYQDFYGLSALPFELTADTRFLFLPPKYREALSVLRYGVMARKGLTVLTGDAGLGKTTLVRAAFQEHLKAGARVLCVNNPALTRDEFFECLADGFRLSSAAGQSKTALLRELQELLADTRARGVPTALVVDEAQSLPHELLEEIRLLGNIETWAEKLLPIVLAGQPELAARLNEPSLRQLKQRVALRCHLESFSLPDTIAYISARVRAAGVGAVSALFTPEAIALVHQRSRGIPRTINVICDNALVTGFAAGRRPVDAALVREVCRDFDFDLHSQAVIPGNEDVASAPPAARVPAVAPVVAAPVHPPLAARELFKGRAAEPRFGGMLSSRPWRAWLSRTGDL